MGIPLVRRSQVDGDFVDQVRIFVVPVIGVGQLGGINGRAVGRVQLLRTAANVIPFDFGRV